MRNLGRGIMLGQKNKKFSFSYVSRDTFNHQVEMPVWTQVCVSRAQEMKIDKLYLVCFSHLASPPFLELSLKLPVP
jgi:hypothetical protein